MKLYLIGVNHFDPQGRGALIRTLRQLLKQQGTAPAFVAVEYDERQFTAYSSQRPRFRRLLEEKWTELSEQELNCLTQSLAYEGDAHLDVFGQVATIWLDAGRFIVPQDEQYAEGRLLVYSQQSGGNPVGRIDVLSQRIKEIAGKEVNQQRSRKFAERLAEATQSRAGKWATSITGVAHTRPDVPGSMRTHLDKARIPCEAIEC